MTNYNTMSAPEFLDAVGIDAQKWSEAFMQITKGSVDEGDMIGWFSNAMMAMHDHLHGNPIMNGDHAQYLIDKETGK